MGGRLAKMTVGYNYWLIWFLYTSAGVIFYAMLWWLTSSRSVKWGNYSLRAMAAAIIFTPWYANTQGAALAPALMVFLLDFITIGSTASLRAATPLFVVIILTQLISTILYLSRRRRFKKQS